MNDYATRYGVREDNNIADAAYDSSALAHGVTVDLGDPDLVRIDRIRLLTEAHCPFFDLSYCYGTLRDGRHVRVDLGRYQFARARGGRGKSIKGQLIECAREAGVNAKRLHMLDDDVISILW